MGVKISLQIGALDQSRQRPMFGRLDFAAILAQFRRNPRKTERRVYFFLRGSRETLGAAEQSVLAELQAFLLRQTPDPDGVVATAGQIMQRRPEALRRQHADIHLQPVSEHSGCLGGARRVQRLQVVISLQRLDGRRALACAHDHVEVAHHIAAAPIAARNFDLHHAGDAFQIGLERPRVLRRNRESQSAWLARLGGRRREQLRADFGPESAQCGQSPVRQCMPQVFDSPHL